EIVKKKVKIGRNLGFLACDGAAVEVTVLTRGRVATAATPRWRLAYETLTDWVDTTASAFLGLTLGCARCHDHKFDPFTQADYFSLQAVYATAREVELPLWTSHHEADWRQSYPKVVAVEEARKAYRLFDAQTRGKQLAKEQQTRKQELLNAI